MFSVVFVRQSFYLGGSRVPVKGFSPPHPHPHDPGKMLKLEQLWSHRTRLCPRTCSNLFKLDLVHCTDPPPPTRHVQTCLLWSTDCEKASGWHSIEIHSCSLCVCRHNKVSHDLLTMYTYIRLRPRLAMSTLSPRRVCRHLIHRMDEGW